MMIKNQALFHKLLFCFVVLINAPVQAQIIPDNTLGTEASLLTPIVEQPGTSIDLINGGALRGNNLFHSFSEFNIKNGQAVYFANPVGVINILTRVTGKNASNIRGTLGVDGNANLFLINPNGILFGRNASLNVQGSFIGTTANGVQFGNQGNFSATEPSAPGLLTINPSALFFNQINPNAGIQNNSVAPAGKDATGMNAFGLRVKDGSSLLLIGGNVSISRGRVVANGGHIELGGLIEAGNISIQTNGDKLSLSFPSGVQRGDVVLANRSVVETLATDRGSIAVNARNIDISGRSVIFAGIDTGLGTIDSQAGDITLNATGEVNITDSGSGIRNLVRTDAKGSSGNIIVNADSFNLGEDTALSASTFGQGNAGNVTLTVKDTISLTGGDILSTVEEGGVGKGGNIEINAANLSLKNGAQLLTIVRSASNNRSSGKGDAGSVNVNVSGVVDITGSSDTSPSGIRSRMQTGTEGNGGNITVNAGSFNLGEGTSLIASTSGKGNAGNVTLTVKDTISLTGGDILSTVNASGVGKGGNIEINAANLELSDGASLITSVRSAFDNKPAGKGDAGSVNINVSGLVNITSGRNGFRGGIISEVESQVEGHGGNITVNAGSFNLGEDTTLNTSTSGIGNAGNVTLTVKDTISLIGGDILSTVESGGVGKGGNIEVNAANLSLQNGAQLITSVRSISNTKPPGKGDAGNVNVNVSGLVDITGQKNGFFSNIISEIESQVEGQGGNITVNAGSLNLGEGTALNTSTLSIGNAGNVTLTAKDTISLTGANIFSTLQAGGVGKGGNIEINAANLSLQNGAQLVTIVRSAHDNKPAGKGNAGNVNVNVSGLVDITGTSGTSPSGISSLMQTGTEGNGGNIIVNAGSFNLGENAALNTSTSGIGNAGNVILTVKDTISSTGGDILSTVDALGVGKGGNIEINAANLSLNNGAQIITSVRSTSNNQPPGKGDAGNVNVNVSELIDIRGERNGFFSGIISEIESQVEGHGGDITVNAGSLNLGEGTALNTSTFSIGNAGNVTLTAKDTISLTGGKVYSTLQAGGVGKGGNIEINAANLELSNGGSLVTSVRSAYDNKPAGKGDAGNVNVNVSGLVDITGQRNGFVSGIVSEVESFAEGQGGNITVNAGSFKLGEGTAFNTSTSGFGNAGNVTLTVKDTISLTGASIYSTLQAGGVGKGGNIDIKGANLSLQNGAQLVTIARSAYDNKPAGKGDAGNVNVNVSGLVDITSRTEASPSLISSLIQTGTEGNGGNITVLAGSFNLGENAGLNTSTSGIGNAGNVTLTVKDTISLTGGNILSTVDASGVGKGGNIEVNAANLELKNGAQLITSVRSTSNHQPPGKGNAGNVNVNVSGLVDITGQKNGFFSNIISEIESQVEGQGGNITVNAGSFKLGEGTAFNTSTSGFGNAGNVTLIVKDTISLTGASIYSTLQAGGVGKGGNIDIKGANLSLQNGAQLVTIARSAYDNKPAGKGDAGNVNVNVSGLVDITSRTETSPSLISSLVQTGTKGNAGNITVLAGSFNLGENAGLNTSTSGIGNAGNVTLTAKDTIYLIGGNILSTVESGGVGKGGNIEINGANLSLKNGAQLITSVLSASNNQSPGKGNAGNVNVNVSGLVDITGKTGTSPSLISSQVETGTEGNSGNITVLTGSFKLGENAALSASTSGLGSAGTIKVNVADVFTIFSNSPNFSTGLFVNSQSATGAAGDIIVNSPQIHLGNQAKLSAESASGNGGNINLDGNLLLMRRGGQITTNAGTRQKGGDGGNIYINSNFIVAVPHENSDITANAYSGKGGNVFIRTQGILGIEPRATESPLTSDITASSELGVQGQISITEPDVQPAQGLIELPEEVVDATKRVAQICPRVPGAKPLGEFTITGRGSLPPSPLEPLPGATNTTKLATLDSNNTNVSNTYPNKVQNAIVEAQGWVKNVDGSMELVAMASNTTPNARVVASVCPSQNSE